MSQSFENYRGAPRTDIDIITPIDRVRWGPIIAGLFAAMSVLVLLGVLGVAIGLSNVDADDRARNYGIGAGVWGAISALVAFFFGGWISARTAAAKDTRNGVLQGGMVWMVAIPLMVFIVAGGLSSITRTAAEAAAPVAQSAARADDNGSARTASFNGAADRVRNTATTQNVERAAQTGGRVAWGTLISLLLGLGAAIVGGLAGGRMREDGPSDRIVANS